MTLFLTYTEVMAILDKVDTEYNELIEEKKFGCENYGTQGKQNTMKIRREINQFMKRKYNIKNK